jgi:hypothetical protein
VSSKFWETVKKMGNNNIIIILNLKKKKKKKDGKNGWTTNRKIYCPNEILMG